MEDDLFQGDFQDYLENGDLYSRCFFQWSLVQSLVLERHLLLEMKFASDTSTDDYVSSEYTQQTVRILERAVNAVIKGTLIRSICFTPETTREDIQTIYDQLNHGKCSILIAYNMDVANPSVQLFFYNNILLLPQERLFCCIVAVRYSVYPYPSSSGSMALTFPTLTDPLYLSLFHISIPLSIPDTSKFSLWDLLGLVENQAKLTEDLHNGLSCDKIEEELKRDMYYRICVDDLKEIKINLSRVYMSLEIKQRIVELISVIRGNSMTADYSPKNSLSYLESAVSLSALMEGKSFCLPRHVDSLIPIIATHLRLKYTKDNKMESRILIVKNVFESLAAVI